MTERIAFPLREAAKMLGYKSPGALYRAAYLPPDHEDYVPTIKIPPRSGRLCVPAAWLYAEIERQTNIAGRVVSRQSAQLKPSQGQFGAGVALAGGDPNSKEGSAQ